MELEELLSELLTKLGNGATFLRRDESMFKDSSAFAFIDSAFEYNIASRNYVWY